MICKFLKYLQKLFDNMLINLFFPFSFSTSESKLNQIIEDIEKNRYEIELYIKNNDPLTSHFCSLRHTTCASNDPLLVWAKDYDHRYITANDTHLRVFYDKTLYQLDDLVGNTDMELIEEYRSNGHEHTFGELCISTDEIVKKKCRAMRFFEFGYKRSKPLLLDVWKSPILSNDGFFRGTVGRAINMSDRESDIYELLQHYLDKGIAIRIDTDGLDSCCAIYEIKTSQRSFNRMFPK